MAEEAIFSFLLETLGNLVIQEAQFLRGVDDQVQSLQQQLKQMRWFLRDTSSSTSQDGQKRVLEWVLDVRDLAYQAEYLIESYAFKVASRRGRGIKIKIKRFVGIFNEGYHRHQIGSNIESLITKITKLATNFNEYGIRQILEHKDNNGANRRAEWRKTYSTTNEEDLFVGSGDAINTLAEKLVSDHYRTVSLHGMGGLGKTTLARKVYQHPTVRKHFDGFSWVAISQQWQKHDILRRILIKLLPDQKRDEISKWTDEELVRELQRFIRTTKCLIVLDDIWTIDAWVLIEPAIPIRENGSKVMITTRIKDVATLLDGPGYLHEPQYLTNDEGWELLYKKALRGQELQEIEKFKAIGKEIVTRCSGLPLAVMALGGILSSRHSSDEWQNVLDNVNSYLRNDGRLNNVHRILALSYDDLPFHLKPCFLYLSHYREDEEIMVETLYQYWMAEGMVSPPEDSVWRNENETIMDVAEHYLRELADRSLVFVEKGEGYSLRRFKSCRLHDLIRDMCKSKAKEEEFFESIEIHDDAEARRMCTKPTSRISIYLDENVGMDIPLMKPFSRSPRSFIFRAVSDIGNAEKIMNRWFAGFVMLKTLSIEWKRVSHRWRDAELPSSIGKLVHLRYLRFIIYADITVASSIGNLKQLETLDFRGSHVVRMPDVLRKMARLTHLYLPNVIGNSSFGKLRLDGLDKLEILEGFDNKVWNVNDLSTMTNLRKLKATLGDKLEDMEEFMKLVRKLTHLLFLQLFIIEIDFSSEKSLPIINNILSHSHLIDFGIEGELSKWPQYDWGFCRKLQSLILVYSQIEEDPLSALGRLPELRILVLSENSFVGKEMSCHASDFPQLRQLQLSYLTNLVRLEIEAGTMPNLSSLGIQACRRLNTIPSGLRFITSLKTFEALDMSEEFKESLELDLFDEISHIQTIVCN